MTLLRSLLLALAVWLTVATRVIAEERVPEPSRRLTPSEAAPYSEEYWKEYKRRHVHKQICTAFGRVGIADDEEAEIDISMGDPAFWCYDQSGIVLGIRAIGAVGQFRVEFERVVPLSPKRMAVKQPSN